MSCQARTHRYETKVEWTGNAGTGTSGYRDYRRDHLISAGAKPDIPGSSDPALHGDGARWSPQDLLVASISACHKLWYLHLCVEAGVTVLSYADHAVGEMTEEVTGGGRFTGVSLRPRVTVVFGDDLVIARELHRKAHRMCFIANSVNFLITCEAETTHLGGA